MKIWRMNPDGSNQEQVRFSALHDRLPICRPDGQNDLCLLRLMSANSTDDKRVTLQVQPTNSKGNKSIAYILWWPGNYECSVLEPRQQNGRFCILYLRRSQLLINNHNNQVIFTHFNLWSMNFRIFAYLSCFWYAAFPSFTMCRGKMPSQVPPQNSRSRQINTRVPLKWPPPSRGDNHELKYSLRAFASTAPIQKPVCGPRNWAKTTWPVAQ